MWIGHACLWSWCRLCCCSTTYLFQAPNCRQVPLFYCTQAAKPVLLWIQFTVNVCRCHGAVFGGCSPKCSRYAPVLLPQSSCYWSGPWVIMQYGGCSCCTTVSSTQWVCVRGQLIFAGVCTFSSPSKAVTQVWVECRPWSNMGVGWVGQLRLHCRCPASDSL